MRPEPTHLIGWILSFAASQMLTGCPAEPPAVAAATSAVIVLNGTEHAFGMVKQGTLLEHTFRIRNSGPSRIELKHASATCGCTSFRFEPKVLAADEEGSVIVAISTLGRTGSLTATVHAVFVDNSGSEHIQRFEVNCVVGITELITVEPARLHLEIGRPAAFSVECKQLTGRALPVRIAIRTPPPDQVTVHLDSLGSFASIASNDTGRARATGVVTALPHASGASTCVVELDVEFPDGGRERVILPVSVTEPKVWMADPPSIFLGAVEPRKSIVNDVRITTANGSPAVPTLTTSSPLIVARWADGENPPMLGDTDHLLHVEAVSPDRAGVFAGWVELGQEGRSVLRIDIAGIVQ